MREIEEKSKEIFLPIIGRKKGRLLEDLIKKYQPKKVLEIGCLVGYSSILMSKHLPEGSKIITIEINPSAAAMAKENFEKVGVKNIELILGDAMRVIPKLEGSFDFVFIDAEKDEYYSYLMLLEGKLSPKAILVADNVKIFGDEMRDYLEYIRESGNYTSENYEFGDDAMEVSFRLN